MRRESDLPEIFSEENEGVLKKGTGISSIFQKLKNLSRKKSGEENESIALDQETGDEKHISFSAEDSEEPEIHSVTICDANGIDTESVHTEAVDLGEADSGGDDGIEYEELEPEYVGEIYEVVVEEDVEMPLSAPAFVLRGNETELESPSTVINDEHDSQYDENGVSNGFHSEDTNGGNDDMYEEYDSDLADKESREYQEKNADHQDTYAEQHQNLGENAYSSESEGKQIRASELVLSSEELNRISSPRGFLQELDKQGVKAKKFEKRLRYKETLRGLQHECVKLQQSVKRNNERVIVIFEGMELSGKFDTIRKFTKYMDPRSVRVVSLGERSQDEKQEWYFQRYTRHLPKPGEIVFFNRSWYDRGVLEPTRRLCTDEEYGKFLTQAPEFEYQLIENGYKLIKIWLSISSKSQKRRLETIADNGLRNWKLSPFGNDYLEKWPQSKKYRNLMFSWTDKNYSPWTIVSSDKRKRGRLETMRHVLSTLDYDGKYEAAVSITPDARIDKGFHRSMINED